jgi:hypothetical protein
MAKITLKRLKEEVKKVTGSVEDDDGFKAGVCLLAALQVGAAPDKIAKFTGYPRSLVREFGRNLRANGVWKDGGTHADWFGENGGISFCCDVNVARGFMARSQGRTAGDSE